MGNISELTEEEIAAAKARESMVPRSKYTPLVETKAIIQGYFDTLPEKEALEKTMALARAKSIKLLPLAIDYFAHVLSDETVDDSKKLMVAQKMLDKAIANSGHEDAKGDTNITVVFGARNDDRLSPSQVIEVTGVLPQGKEEPSDG